MRIVSLLVSIISLFLFSSALYAGETYNRVMKDKIIKVAVSRRSEPSSRASLMGEQPNPWNLLRLQDETSRHRGAKPPRRCELLGEISLLSPG